MPLLSAQCSPFPPMGVMQRSIRPKAFRALVTRTGNFMVSSPLVVGRFTANIPVRLMYFLSLGFISLIHYFLVAVITNHHPVILGDSAEVLNSLLLGIRIGPGL